MSDDLDDDDRALIARLRALPPEGREPSWESFGRELGRKLDAAPPAPWWRRWWAPALGASLAAATAVTVLVWPHGARAPVVDEPIAVIERDAAPAPIPVPVPAPRPGDAVLALGAEGELEDADLDDADVITEVMAALDDGGEDDEDLTVLDDVPDEGNEGLVPDLDLAWVDELDDADLDAVTAWLDEEEPS